jgi:hypothetical protein
MGCLKPVPSQLFAKGLRQEKHVLTDRQRTDAYYDLGLHFPAPGSVAHANQELAVRICRVHARSLMAAVLGIDSSSQHNAWNSKLIGWYCNLI